jgi:L-rhamnose-H+ transport protein
MPESEKQDVIKEFNFMKGLWVAIFAGVMSACMAFALAAGAPMSDAAKAIAESSNKTVLFAGLPVLIVALLGGFTTNFVWCLYLNGKNKTFKNYRDAGDSSLALNYVFAALAGVIWYLQFFFYTMGTSQMGKYDFSSWTIHMAFIIAFSNVWGILLHEWKGASAKARNLIITGILILVGATIVVGAGTYLKGQEEKAEAITSESVLDQGNTP